MKPFTLFLAVGSLLWASGVPLARAQTPNVTAPAAMSYQGRLVNASGAALPDGTGYEVEVRLWSAPTGGTLVWGARYGGVAVKAGAFNLVLGAAGGAAIAGATTTDLKAAFAAPERYLGLTVTRDAQAAALAGAAEVLPRQQLLSAPYALRSETAGAADQNAVTSLSIKDGDIKSIDIGTGEVKTANLADQAITSAKIADGTIQSANVAVRGLSMDRLAFDYAMFWQELSADPTAVAGWQVREFNAQRVGGMSIVPAAASGTFSRFQLTPGTYVIQASQPSYASGYFLLGLFEATAANTSPVLQSVPGYDITKSVPQLLSSFTGILEVTSTAKSYELRFYVDIGGIGPLGTRSSGAGIDKQQYCQITILRIK